MVDISPIVNVIISKQNNSGYNVNISYNPDNKNMLYEQAYLTTELKVGKYISSFLSQLPTPKSDLFKFTSPDKFLVTEISKDD